MDNKKLLEMKQERANLVTNIRSIMDAHEKVKNFSHISNG